MARALAQGGCRLLLLALVGLVWAHAGPAIDPVLIPVGAPWRYWVGSQPVADPPEMWRARQWDDTAWAVGASGFGASASGYAEVTLLTLPTNAMTVYFRAQFVVADPAAVRWLVLRADYDDALVVYLNGQEVARRGFAPDTVVRVDTPAESTLRKWGEAMLLENGPGCLLPGTNVVAVEVHRSPADPSLAFVPELVANFSRGPSVAVPGADRVEIVWQTPVATGSRVEYGLRATSEMVVADPALVLAHAVTLTNLERGAVYQYQVVSAAGSDEARSEVASFRVPPVGGPVTFAAVADTGAGNGSQQAVARALTGLDPDFVLHAGDIQQTSYLPELEDLRYFSVYRGLLNTRPIFPVMGNHDLWGGLAAFARFPEALGAPHNDVTGTGHFYSFDWGDVHVCALFLPDRAQAEDARYAACMLAPGSPQYRWLTNDLARTTKPWKIVFGHVPVISSGPHQRDQVDGVYDQEVHQSLLLPIFERYGVQLYVSGHDHLYERLGPIGGTHFVVTGGGGAGLYSVSSPQAASARCIVAHHCLKVKVEGEAMELQAVDVNDEILDEWSIQRAPSPTRVWDAAWHTPAIDPEGAPDADGNFLGQAFDLEGTAVPAVHGRDSNLGRAVVNIDEGCLYVGLRDVMIGAGHDVFLFVESPCCAGVASLAGLGDGAADALGEGADAIDFLENLFFTNFAPCVVAVLGDEQADGCRREFARPGAALAGGQGVFRLEPGLPSVAGVRLQQFDRSPQTATGPVLQEQNANFVELAIPLTELGGLQGGDVIRLGAVVGRSRVSTNADQQTRDLDRGFLGRRLEGDGMGPAVLEGVEVLLAPAPDADQDGLNASEEALAGTDPNNSDTDNDGLLDGWEVRHGLAPLIGTGVDGPDGDPDGDGMTNGAEQVAGTEPRAADSCLRLRVIPVADILRIEWDAVPGRWYCLQVALNEAMAFCDLPAPTFPRVASAALEVYEEPHQARDYRARYYRIRVEE